MQLDSVTLTLTKMHNGRLIDQTDRQGNFEKGLRHKVLHEKKTEAGIKDKLGW